MRKLACLVFLLLLPPTTAGAGTVTLAVRGDLPHVAVYIERPADYLALPLLLEVDIDDPVRHIDAIAGALSAVEAALAGKSGLRLDHGSVTISGQRGGKPLSSRHGAGPSSTMLHLLATLSSERGFFSRARQLFSILDGLELPEDVKIRPGTLHLGIEAREKYRTELLRAIHDHVKEAESALDARARLNLSGLEAPVRVVAEDAALVRIFIPYSLSAQSD